MQEMFLTPDLYNAAIRLACPLALAAVGGLISEKAGVLNMTLEGYMLLGAFCAYFGSLFTGNPYMGLLFGGLGGMALSLLHAFFSITVKVNQIVTALGLNMLALGFTSTQYRLIFDINEMQQACKGLKNIKLGVLSDIPVIGPILFDQNIIFYLLLLLIPGVAFILKKTSWGLAIQAAGEHPRALDVAGISVKKVRYLSVLASGFIAGIGGGTLILSGLNIFFDNVTAGKGFIAFAAIVFGKWVTLPTVLATFLFGFFDVMQLRLQALSGNVIPYQIFLALPYVVTLVMLWVVGSAKGPAASGAPYVRAKN